MIFARISKINFIFCTALTPESYLFFFNQNFQGYKKDNEQNVFHKKKNHLKFLTIKLFVFLRHVPFFK